MMSKQQQQKLLSIFKSFRVFFFASVKNKQLNFLRLSLSVQCDC
jgi:hypothetical protein